MIGEELTGIIGWLTGLHERMIERPDYQRALAQSIDALRDVRGRTYGKVLVDPAKMTMELERREAGVR